MLLSTSRSSFKFIAESFALYLIFAYVVMSATAIFVSPHAAVLPISAQCVDAMCFSSATVVLASPFISYFPPRYSSAPFVLA